MHTPDLTQAIWHKSTRSDSNGGNCVEVADNLPGVVAVRDSKDKTGPVLTFAPGDWTAFVDGIRTASSTPRTEALRRGRNLKGTGTEVWIRYLHGNGGGRRYP